MTEHILNCVLELQQARFVVIESLILDLQYSSSIILEFPLKIYWFTFPLLQCSLTVSPSLLAPPLFPTTHTHNMTENGVNLIKKKVAALKTELDECQVRAGEAEEQLQEKETIIEKVRGVFYMLVVSHSVQKPVCLLWYNSPILYLRVDSLCKKKNSRARCRSRHVISLSSRFPAAFFCLTVSL